MSPDEIPPLSMDDCECRYDFDTATAYITYTGKITPQMTTAVYQWMTQSLKLAPEGHVVRGTIFDFTGVEGTTTTNITAAKVHGNHFREEHAPIISNVPTVMVVSNMNQELLVRRMMNLAKLPSNEAQPRVKMVATLDEAKAFIASWHQDADTD